MKKVLLSAFVLVGTSVFGASHPDHIKADGHAFFKAGRGLTRAGINLYVPKMGKGKIILEVGGKEVEAKGFRAHRVAGRTVFDVLFMNVPGTAKGTAALLHGSYLRGNNMAIYYGDFYTKKAGPKMTWDGADQDASTVFSDSASTTAAAKCDCCKDGTCSPDCTCTEEACDTDCPCCDCDETSAAAACDAGDCDCKDCPKGDCKDCDCDKGDCKGGCKVGCKPPKKDPRKHHRGHDHRGWTYGGGFGFHHKIEAK